MTWDRAIVHVDMDTFFVSVERRADPSLEGKPVIVGGGPGGQIRRGVVAACSYETRRFGVHSAMPLAEAIRRCPAAIVVPVGRSDYGAATRRVRQVLDEFTDRVEMTSPDEAYVDLAGTDWLHGPPLAAASRLRCAVRDGVGLPVSAGLAATRAFAKIASKLAKPRGLFAVFPGSEAAIARPLALRALPGLGPRTAVRLESSGVRTLGDLLALDEPRVRSLLGDHGPDLQRRARGEGSAHVQPARDRVQISTESTFAEDIGDPQRLEAILSRMAARVGRRLRRRGDSAGTIAIKLRYPDFTTLTRQAPLAPPARDDRALIRAARELLRQRWDARRPLRLLGVGVSNFAPCLQPDLLTAAEAGRAERLMTAMDRIGDRAGAGKLVWGSTLDASPPATGRGSG